MRLRVLALEALIGLLAGGWVACGPVATPPAATASVAAPGLAPAAESWACLTRDLDPVTTESRRFLLGTRDPDGPPIITPTTRGASDQWTIPPMPPGDRHGGVGQRFLQVAYHERPAKSPASDYDWCQGPLKDLVSASLQDSRAVSSRLEALNTQARRLRDWFAQRQTWPDGLSALNLPAGSGWPVYCLRQLNAAVQNRDLPAAQRWSAELAGALFGLADLHRWSELLDQWTLASLDLQTKCEDLYRQDAVNDYDQSRISCFPGGPVMIASLSSYMEVERQAQEMFRKPEAWAKGLATSPPPTAAVLGLPPHVRSAYRQVRAKLGPANQAVLDRAAASPYERSYLADMLFRTAQVDGLEPLGAALARFDRHYPQAEVWQLMDMFPYRASLASSGIEWGDRYDSRLMAAAATIPATRPVDALEAAREFQYKIYGGSANYAGLVLTLRKALDTGKMDCLRATDMIAAVCRNAGCPGFLHVRWCRGSVSGHSIVGMQTFAADGSRQVMMADGLFRPGTHTGTWPDEYFRGPPDVYAVELLGRGLDGAILQEAYIIKGPNAGTLIRFRVPYLPGAEKSDAQKIYAGPYPP